MDVPEWLRDVLLAIGAFIGGRAVNSIGEQIKEGRELRRGVDRLTIAVENLGGDLKDIRDEIHGQVAGLKIEIHDQVAGLRSELHGYQIQQDNRISSIEAQAASTAARIDQLSCKGMQIPQVAWIPQVPPSRARLNQEMGCYHPLGEASQE